MQIKTTSVAILLAVCTSCQMNTPGNKQTEMSKFKQGTFGYDLDYLKAKDSVIVLKSDDGNGQIIVSAKYQAKVFTSTAAGLDGKSFGWINYKAFTDTPSTHMNAYGGEDRLWLGPEGGKFSIFFKPGTQMVFDNWHTPPAIDTESWTLVSSGDKKAAMSKEFDLQNYAGTKMKLKAERDIEIIEKKDIEQQLGISLNDKVNSVGFKTTNSLTNAGDNEWNEKTGAPCTWNLDMFAPSPKTVIIIPYLENAAGKVATTSYFGEIPKDRVTYQNGILLYKADGKSRGKLGIPPVRVKNVAGSYAADTKVLTIALFDIDNKAKYLNQEWTPDKDPFSGDAMNAYNDGPLQDGTQMGPFYEMESVSPPAFLKPGAKLTHHHSVFHFIGDEAGLEAIAKKVLGVSLKDVEKAFN